MENNNAEQEITVCIIIPAYNVEKYVSACLDSVINQIRQPDEVIVVDDGSTDKTALIIHEYAEKYPFIFYVFQENQGQGKARNMALELTRASHIMFLDSDDFIHDQTIARCVEWITKENPDLVHFEHRKLYENGNISYPKENSFFDGVSVVTGAACEMILSNSTYYTCNNLFRRGFLVENDIKYGIGVSVQDYVFLAKVGILAQKICLIHAPLYTYRIHSESTSNKYRESRIQFESFLTGTKECLSASKETNASERAIAYIINHKIRAYIHMYFEKTSRKYRKEFLTCLYECFQSGKYQSNQFLSKRARQFIGDGKALTRKKYSYLLRLTYINGLRRRLRKYSGLKRIYRFLRKSIKGAKRRLKSIRKKVSNAFVSRFEAFYSNQPILEQTMTIIGQNGQLKGNGKYLYYILKDSFPNWRIVYLHKKDEYIPSNVDAANKDSLQGRSLVFRSKVLFIESWERYPKRDDRLVIQLWHGTPMKKMLFDTNEPFIMKRSPNHRSVQYKQILTWDYFVCDSIKAKDYFRSCFLLEDSKILPSGYPRVKYLLDNASNEKLKQEIRASLGVKSGERIISYFSTWRDYSLGASEKDQSYLLDQRAFLKHLNNETPHRLFSSEHSFGNNKEKKAQHKYDTQDFILASDWVISDYSSVIFDALAISIPVALLMKDREKYEEARGLYQDVIDDLGFCIAANEVELAGILNNPPDVEKYEFVRKKYCQLPNEFSLIDDLSQILESPSSSNSTESA